MTDDLDFHIILYHAVMYSHAIWCVYCVLFICACMRVRAHVCMWRHITCACTSEDSMWVLDTELKLSGVTLPVEFLHWLSSYILREPTWRNANAILSYYFSKISAAEECFLDGRRVCTRARRNYRDPGEKQKTPNSVWVAWMARGSKQTRKMERGRGWGGGDRGLL